MKKSHLEYCKLVKIGSLLLLNSPVKLMGEATSPLPSLTLLVLGLLFTSFALVESQNPFYVASLPPPPPPPSPPTTSSPPPPHPMTSPPHPQRVHPDWRKRRHHRPPPPPPPPPANKMNFGKKIGLLFAGIAGFLQIGVVVLLVFRRRQLLSTVGRYENCSS